MQQPLTPGTGALGLQDLAGNKKRHRRENIVRGLFQAAAIASIVISAAIVLSLAGKAWAYVAQVDLSALWSSGWFPRRGLYDLRTIIAGTLIITGIAMLVAAPLGLGAALYLAEYAKPRVRRILKPILEILASIPSVVLGVFALTFISPEIVQAVFVDAGIFSLLAA
ncbi:MAG: phosphate ABC transporter permease subunit PstC, partial [Actinomycetota bacterium]|nr:phosphate ABC transporter permease subunit PstC [Actinomycetota bacterium]